jgi:hypothetical protein
VHALVDRQRLTEWRPQAGAETGNHPFGLDVAEDQTPQSVDGDYSGAETQMAHVLDAPRAVPQVLVATKRKSTLPSSVAAIYCIVVL